MREECFSFCSSDLANCKKPPTHHLPPNKLVAKIWFRSKSLFIDLILSYEEHAVIVLIWHFLMIITHNITIIGSPSNPTF